MKVLTVLGACPQFIKSAPVSRALQRAGIQEIIVHTGQHYDHNMSAVFFQELEISEPDINLGVGSGPHGQQTGRMLMALENVLQEKSPDCLIVYGDTNSTLAGSLAAAKLDIPIAHVEAGLHSYNWTMPEEHNRVLTDHCADILFCLTPTAVKNLETEKIRRNVHLVGDTMLDTVRQFSEIAQYRSNALQCFGLVPRSYLVATIHRPYNVDNPENLHAILRGLIEIGKPVILPVHPRTKHRIAAIGEPFGSALAASNILWFFAQYDISLIPSLDGEEPKSIVATDGNYRFANLDNVKTGNRRKIQNNGSVYKCETLESGVLYGPSKTITNVNNHWAENPQSAIVETNTVAHKDKLESNATIVCGISIVGNAFIGTGADISMDVLLWRTADDRPEMPGASGGG